MKPMKALKKLIVSAVMAAMIVTTSGANAAPCYEQAGGCGYEECRRAPCIAPAVALGAIALAAIIAVAIQNSNCGHSHSNCHS